MKAARFLLLMLSACGLAQVHQHAPPADGSPLDLAKLPAPQSIAGIGHSHFEITTKSAEAQRWFDQGLALLHCFWDYEALRAFEQAVRLDPGCAMCYWGVSQAISFRGGREEQSKAQLSKAKELSTEASDREQRLIYAFTQLQERSGDEGKQAFEKEMAVLVDRYPDELEIRLIMAWHANGGYQKALQVRLRSIHKPCCATFFKNTPAMPPPTIIGFM